MKIVIGCSKNKIADPFVYNGKEIEFTAYPKKATKENCDFFHPDDIITQRGISWRDLVEQLQHEENNNLVASCKIYKRKIYKDLYNKFGDNLLIFSAGWGIITAQYRIPCYDISFSSNSPSYSKRLKTSIFQDHNHLIGTADNENIVLIAGYEYALAFCKITKNLKNKKIIFYKNRNLLKNNEFVERDDFEFIYYQTTINTNWQYDLAKRLISNSIEI